MNALIRKEARLVLASLIPMAAVTATATWLFSSADQALATFGLAAAFNALGPIGHEFSLGTFSGLLSQPMTRQRLWLLKAAATAASIAFLAVVFMATTLLRGQIKDSLIDFSFPAVALLALIALAGALWTTLLFRQTAMAFLFTILAPLFVLAGWTTFYVITLAEDPMFLGPSSYALLVVYSVIAILWSRRRFLRVEDTEILGKRLMLRLRRGIPAPTSATRRRAGASPMRALLWKELLSHQMAFVLALALACTHLGILVLGWFATPPHGSTGFMPLLLLHDVARFLWIFIPVIVGGAAIAGEREEGTIEAQLCLPVARWRQFALKLLVVLVLSFLLGSVLPGTIEGVGQMTNIHREPLRCAIEPPIEWNILSCHIATLSYDDYSVPRDEFGVPIDAYGGAPFERVSRTDPPLYRVLITLAMTAGVALVSFLASSLARNPLEAMGAAFIAVPSLAMLVVWTLKETLTSPYQFSFWKGPLVFLIGLPAVAAAMVALSLLNYPIAKPGRRTWLRSSGVVAITLAASGLAAAVIYPRPWERWTSEPRHTSARLAGHIAPKICSTGGRIVALLPDGRLWVSTRIRFWRNVTTQRPWFWPTFPEGTHFTPVPETGELLPGNWRSVSCREVDRWTTDDARRDEDNDVFLKTDGYAIASDADGRLERISWDSLASPTLESIGSHTDWIGILASGYTDVFFAYGANEELWQGTYQQGDLHRAERVPERLEPDIRKLQDGNDRWHPQLWNLAIMERNNEIQAPFRNLYPPKSRYSDWIVWNFRHEYVALAIDGTICAWEINWTGYRWPGTSFQVLAPSNRPTWCLNVLAGRRMP